VKIIKKVIPIHLCVPLNHKADPAIWNEPNQQHEIEKNRADEKTNRLAFLGRCLNLGNDTTISADGVGLDINRSKNRKKKYILWPLFANRYSLTAG
jgi:hypothetical protein